MKIFTQGLVYNEAFELTRLFYPGEEFGELEAGVQDSDALFVLPDDAGVTFRLRGREEHYDRTDLGLNDKNFYKANLYRFLSKITGKELPWGAVTGIRPVRLATTGLMAGHTAEQVLDDLMNIYCLSKEKAALSLLIAKNQMPYLKPELFDKVSLYIGIPYCPSVCSYCSFGSLPVGGREQQLNSYVDTLCEELKRVSPILRQKKKDIHTIYIGGGTPSVLNAEQIEKIFFTLDTWYDTDRVEEITFEAGRPDTITAEKLRTLREVGVNRLSLNPQTMQNRTLSAVGRLHTAEDIINCYAMIKEHGDFQINMDLILGLPGETVDDVKDTLRKVNLLNPDNVTVHSLYKKRAAALEGPQTDTDVAKEMMDVALKANLDKGRTPYYLYRQKQITANLENIGFAKPGTFCEYNIQMMEERQQTIAFGAGASSKLIDRPTGLTTRLHNYKDPALYLRDFEKLMDNKLQKLTELL